jgi:hypothetical protein
MSAPGEVSLINKRKDFEIIVDSGLTSCLNVNGGCHTTLIRLKSLILFINGKGDHNVGKLIISMWTF